jgi:hypothetical protein
MEKKRWVWWHVPVIPDTVRSLKQEAHSPGWPGQKQDPIFQNNQSKNDWWCGSNSKAPAQQMRNCEFKPYKQKGWGHGSSSTLLALHV